jgi:hypothetical protein
LNFSAAAASAEPPAGQGESDAQLLRSRIEQRMEKVRNLSEVQSQILLMLRARMEELAHDTSHSQSWITQRQDAVVAEAVKALDNAEAAAAEALAEISEQARRAAGPRKPPSTQDAILEQMQLQNAWISVSQLLDGAKGQADALAAVEAACASAAADPLKLAALKQFGDDWVSKALAGEPRYAQERVRGVMAAAIDAAEAPMRTPLQAAAHAILADAERGNGRLQANSQLARKEIGWGAKAGALAGWDDGEAIMHSYRGQIAPAEAISAGFGPQARAWAISAQKNYPVLAGAPEVPTGAAAIIQQLGGQVAE